MRRVVSAVREALAPGGGKEEEEDKTNGDLAAIKVAQIPGKVYSCSAQHFTPDAPYADSATGLNVSTACASQDGKLYFREFNVEAGGWAGAKEARQPRFVSRGEVSLRSAWVMCSAVSPDGRLACSGGLDNQVSLFRREEVAGAEGKPSSCVWAEDTGTSVASHDGYVSSADFFSALSPSSLLSGSGDTTVKLWDLEGGISEVHSYKDFEGDVMGVAACRLAPLFAGGATSGEVNIFDARDHSAVLQLPKLNDDVNAVSWSETENLVASASDDSFARVYDIRNPEQALAEYKVGEAGVSCAALSRLGRYLYAGGDDGDLMVFDTRADKDEAPLHHKEQSRVSSLCEIDVPGSQAILMWGCWDGSLNAAELTKNAPESVSFTKSAAKTGAGNT